jgi:hypothetical protein
LQQGFAHLRRLSVAQQTFQRLADQALRRTGQQDLNVGADLNDRQFRLAEGQQQSMGLDRTGKTDRFVGTVGQ